MLKVAAVLCAYFPVVSRASAKAWATELLKDHTPQDAVQGVVSASKEFDRPTLANLMKSVHGYRRARAVAEAEDKQDAKEKAWREERALASQNRTHEEDMVLNKIRWSVLHSIVDRVVTKGSHETWEDVFNNEVSRRLETIGGASPKLPEFKSRQEG